jgi:hypothetical protein
MVFAEGLRLHYPNQSGDGRVVAENRMGIQRQMSGQQRDVMGKQKRDPGVMSPRDCKRLPPEQTMMHENGIGASFHSCLKSG